MRTRLLLLLLYFIGLLTSCQREKETRVTDFVDPFIGTAGQGHCFPGATVPFGGIQLVRIIQEVAGNGVLVIIIATVLYPHFPTRI